MLKSGKLLYFASYLHLSRGPHTTVSTTSLALPTEQTLRISHLTERTKEFMGKSKMADRTDEDEVKGQFLFCSVCRLNHDKGRKHIYSKKHKALLSKLLTKFGKKVRVSWKRDTVCHVSRLLGVMIIDEKPSLWMFFPLDRDKLVKINDCFMCVFFVRLMRQGSF